jgi:hypothetical protein
MKQTILELDFVWPITRNEVETMLTQTMHGLLLTSALLFSFHASGEQSTDSTGEYAIDLGQVYGAAQSVKFMKEICNEAFPAFTKANDSAYQKWRARYLPFLQELEKHWTAFAWQEAEADPKRHTEFLTHIAEHFDQYKQGLKKQMECDGPEAFRKQCELYPVYLTKDRTNLEYFYAEQVATVRRGPEKK